MAQAYVGTADSYGLRAFLLEDKTNVADVASDARIGRIPFWATVSEELAWKIRQHLRLGERQAALSCLELQAIELAPLLPSVELLQTHVARGTDTY